MIKIFGRIRSQEAARRIYKVVQPNVFHTLMPIFGINGGNIGLEVQPNLFWRAHSMGQSWN